MTVTQSSNHMSQAHMQQTNADATTIANTTESTRVDAILPAPAPDVTSEYKIVRVRKPDGTIVKVKRRVTAASDVVAPKPPPPALPEETAKVSPKKTTQATPSKTVPLKVTSELSQSKDVEISAGEAKPKITSRRVDHRSTSARAYHLFRGVHRLRSDFNSAVGNFDPNGDLGNLEGNADDYDGDSYSESNNSSSSDDDKDGRGTKRGKNSVPNNKNDSTSVYSYAEGDSEYQQSDHDGDANRIYGASSQDIASPANYTTPTGRLTSHTTTKEVTSTVKQAMLPIEDTTDTTADKGKSGVVIHEKELRADTDSGSAKARERQYRKLKRRSRLSQAVVWTIMIGFPILFLALGVLTAVLNGTRADSYKGFAMTEAIKGAVTAWPIIFAAIIAQSLKQLASYKVERGLRLMTLEQLISSHSVGAAIKQPFFLRRFDWIGIALLCLWSLSPLASQALQRMSYLGYISNKIAITVPYIDTTGYNSVFSNWIIDSVYAEAEFSQGLFTSCLMAPPVVQDSPMDTWNNTKIPLIEGLNGMVDGWYPVHTNATSQFSSLLGIPLQIPAEYTSDSRYEAAYSELDIVMQSAYLTVTNCTSQVIMSKQDINQSIIQLGSSMSESPSGTLLMSLKLSGKSYQAMSYDHETYLPGILTFSSVTDTGTMTGGNGSTPQYSYTVCNITQTFVDSQVSCHGPQCQVVGMRPSLNVTALSPFIAMGTPGSDFGPAFMDSFVNVSCPSAAGFSSLTEQYINDPTFVTNPNATTTFNLATISITDLQQRLALLLNTYWQSGFAPSNQTTGVIGSNGQNFGGVKYANATYYQSSYAYVTSWAWVTVLFVSSIILLAAGIASAFLDAYTIGPDVLGFASSMTRNNKYMDLPREDSTLSGVEWARALGDVKVMMQDVKPAAAVGKIALGTVSEGTRRLTHGRMYR